MARLPTLARFTALHQDRWPFAVPIGLAIGIGIYFFLNSEPSWFIGPVILALVVAGLAYFYSRQPRLRLALLAICFIAIGFSSGAVRTGVIGGLLLTKETAFTGIEGRIIDLQPFDRGMRVVLDHVRVSTLQSSDTPEQVRIRMRGTQPNLEPGDWISVRGRLSPPSPPILPGGFDFQRHAFFTGIGAVGFSIGVAKLVDGPKPGFFDWRIHLGKVRLKVTELVRKTISGDAGTVAAALLTGHRTIIPDNVLSDVRRAGLAHLLAISGLHIGLAAGIVFFGLRGMLVLCPGLAMRIPAKKIAAMAAFLIAGAYALLAGATVPTQRAFFIAGLVLVAVMVDRRGVSLRLLAWGATVILILQPESILGPSFQMSFAAAIALVSAYEYLSERRNSRSRPARDIWFSGIFLYAGGVAFTTIVASFATAPFVVFHFNEVAKYGLLANLVAVPVTALWVMPAAMVSFLLMPFGAEGPVLTLMGWGVEIVLLTSAWVSNLPNTTMIFPSAPTWALIVLALSALWICLIRGPARLIGIAGITVWATSIGLARAPDVIISSDGKLAAVLEEKSGYRFSTLKSGRFARDGWLAHAGFSADNRLRWPDAENDAHQFRCDDQGCIIKKLGTSLGIALTREAAFEDCGQVAMMIALVPAFKHCRKSTEVIDIFDLRLNGTHAFWLGPRIRIKTVNEGRGERPWVVYPKTKPKNASNQPPSAAPAKG